MFFLLFKNYSRENRGCNYNTVAGPAPGGQPVAPPPPPMQQTQQPLANGLSNSMASILSADKQMQQQPKQIQHAYKIVLYTSLLSLATGCPTKRIKNTLLNG